MAYFLAKTDPEIYSIEQLKQDGKTLWDGVRNAQAVAFVQRLARPVTPCEIKESHLFDDWSLVRQSRLSTMSVPDSFVSWLKEKKVL